LLESIRDTGSVSAAARDMGMSYKRTWVLVDSINRAIHRAGLTAALDTRDPHEAARL